VEKSFVRRFSSPFSSQKQLVYFAASWVAVQFGGTGEPGSTGWYRGQCPCCYGSRDSLSLKNVAGGRLHAVCFRGCDREEIHHRIGLMVRQGGYTLPSPVDPTSRDQPDQTLQFRMVGSARIWHASSPNDLIKVYIDHRCIELDRIKVPLRWDDLRIHPALWHRPSGQYAPAMVALLHDVNNDPCAIHRTWLSPDGKAKAAFEPVRMALGAVSGAAVRLADADKEVLIGEGIESTLSAMELQGLPGWAALSTSGMTALHLPPSIRRAVIAADNDAPGLKAAWALCRRLEAEDRKVSIIKPKRWGDDFNDMLRQLPVEL
jgi:hypothetical protein